MKTHVLGAIALMLAGSLATPHVFGADAPKTVSPQSGIVVQHGDKTVRAQDDFFRHVNGAWLKDYEIPADRASAGAFYDLRIELLPQLHAIIEGQAKAKSKPGSDAQKVADTYATFMDTAAIEAQGVKPLQAEFARIDALKDAKQIPALLAWMNQVADTAPYDITVHQDNKDATKYVLDLGQGGLGMPDRDYYLNDTDAKLKDTRAKYLAHVEKMLSMAGDKDAAKHAAEVVALETELAKAQWSKVELRDPIKAYNKVELSKMAALAPGYDWAAYFKALGVDKKITYVIVAQPSYLTAFAKTVQATPLDVWKTYFKWHLLKTSAQQLPQVFADEGFAFYGTTLAGTKVQEDRWKRGVRLVDGQMGESLGKLYVAQHFPPENKARMEKLVSNLLLAFKQSIDTLDWMSPATKKEAQLKLSTFVPKIGYPKHWRDYSKLKVVKGDAVGNLRRAKQFAVQYELNKLGRPIDRNEWGMTPQTVNAYYNPEMNEIVFPAAILQPPFFDARADDAVNYGAIGAVIGHEISHGFDDQGAQYDEKGNLRDWWTAEDHAKFKAKTTVLVQQYNGFSPLPGYNVNGELTLGENIADNSGLAIAFKAWKLSLGGKPGAVIDGMTGEQRFFAGWGQAWRTKMREQQMIVRIKTDPHSPGEFRANGPLRNMAPFYDTYGVKDGDQMYLAPDKRVSIW